MLGSYDTFLCCCYVCCAVSCLMSSQKLRKTWSWVKLYIDSEVVNQNHDQCRASGMHQLILNTKQPNGIVIFINIICMRKLKIAKINLFKLSAQNITNQHLKFSFHLSQVIGQFLVQLTHNVTLLSDKQHSDSTSLQFMLCSPQMQLSSIIIQLYNNIIEFIGNLRKLLQDNYSFCCVR